MKFNQIKNQCHDISGIDYNKREEYKYYKFEGVWYPNV
jgi:hypothetical protein